MPPGNSCFLTPSVTPRPPNRPRKMGKLTPGKNPGTTGSAGRSDPARDACGRPRAFHLLFFHTSLHCWFLRKPCAWWEVKSWHIRRLRWWLLSGPGSFLFFLPNSPLCGPNRPLTGLGRVVSPPGVETGHTGPPGGEQGPWVVLWDDGCGWFSQVPEGTQGAQNSTRGGWAGFASLAGYFFKGARRQCVPVYSSAYTQYVGDLIFPNTR